MLAFLSVVVTITSCYGNSSKKPYRTCCPLQLSLSTVGISGYAHVCPTPKLALFVRISAPMYTHTFNGPFSETTWVSRYQKGKTNLDFTEARDNEWQWHRLGHIQVCTSLQTDNHTSTPPLSFLLAGCPSCCAAA